MSEYLLPLGLMFAGSGLLIAGGEMLVRGAARLAALAGISPLVVGLTVVALGTSAPEMAVTLRSTLAGSADLAVGNVVGSNICNVLLILGLSALAAPLTVSVRLIRWDVPLVVAASFLVLVLGLDGAIGRWDGGLLFTGLIAYVGWAVYESRWESRTAQAEFEKQYEVKTAPRRGALAVQAALIAAGLVLLTLGSHWLVEGAVAIARLLGVGELLIGLTIVALGTSLPELAASVIASLRGQRDIAVGNIVGSNLFNLLGVLGLSGLLAPHGVAVSQVALHVDIPVMIAVAVACLPILFTGYGVARWEGGFLFAYYVAYTTYLVLDATHAAWTRTFTQALFGFAFPLTGLTLAFTVARALRQPRESGRGAKPERSQGTAQE